MGLQDLREERHSKAETVKALLAQPVYSKQTEAKVDSLYGEIDLIDSKMRHIEKSIASDDILSDGWRDDSNPKQNAQRAEAARKAFVNALRIGAERLSPEERSLISADAPGNRGRIQNVAEGAATTGGYLVPTIVMPSVQVKLKAFGGMRTVANVISTSGGSPMSWPTMDDTTASGELVAENVTASVGDLAFGQVTINAYKFSSKIVPVSIEVLQDASVNVESLVLDALATRIARGQNAYFTNGTGVSQPQGVLSAAALGHTLPTGNTSTITFDGLMNLYHAVDPAYRASPNCAFMMNDQTWKAVKQLKDAAGRPLWLPTTGGAMVSDSSFDTLLGKRLVINQDMPSIGANAKPILFGAFDKYMIRDVMDVLVLRFTDSAFAKFGQVGFLAWARSDGRLIDASNASIQYLQNSAT